MTVGELRTLTGRVAAGLAARGFRPGDALAMLMPMTAEAVAIYLGIIQAGLRRRSASRTASSRGKSPCACGWPEPWRSSPRTCCCAVARTLAALREPARGRRAAGDRAAGAGTVQPALARGRHARGAISCPTPAATRRRGAGTVRRDQYPVFLRHDRRAEGHSRGRKPRRSSAPPTRISTRTSGPATCWSGRRTSAG